MLSLNLNFSPFPEIMTDRLLLRSLTMEDLSAMYFLRTDPQVIEHFNRPPDASPEVTKQKMNDILQAQEKNEGILWVICLKDDPATMIGNFGYWRIIKEHFRAEIGYLLHPNHWRKGIMKEVMQVLVPYAFDVMKIHSIEANINPDNIASGALLESCGFEKEAYHRENYYHDGKFYDSIIYSRINEG